MTLSLKTALKMTAVAGLGLALVGCTSTSKALGLTKSTPNEFNILTKAPLVVPPEYNLRPPQIGESSSENNYTQKAAREALIGNIDPTEPSNGEIVLLSKAGVARANQEIRLVIDGENAVERKSKGFTDQVLFWRDGKAVTKEGQPLDAENEERRLRSVSTATGDQAVTITKRPSRAKLPGL